MRTIRAAAFSLLWLAAATAAAQAHPLGNFTINHLAKVQIHNSRVHIRYILDIAEIPTFQIVQQNGGVWKASTLQRWADSEQSVVLDGLTVTENGVPLALKSGGARASVRSGAGGLPILRWVGQFSTPAVSGTCDIRIDDRVYASRRIGWKDLIAGAQVEPTDELQHYPSALIGSPRRISSIMFRTNGRKISDIVRSSDPAPVIATSSSWFAPTVLSDMFARPGQTPLFVLLTILAAFGLGALHAVEPGHGKTLLAFTLVGSRATAKQAFILAGSLTFAHTMGVFLLGAVLFFAAGFVSETIYPWITLVSGIVIAVIGARSLARFLHNRREHDHSHGHSHAIAGSQPLNFGSAVWAAMSGGVAPCPAAIVVLLAALRLHHLVYGMLLIVIFSMGLATVLSGLGLGVVHGASWLSKRSSYARLAPYGPLVTASVISVIGSVLLAQGLQQQGIPVPVPLLAALTLAAIGGFAFSQSAHGHSHGPHHHHHHHHQLEADAL